MAALDFFEPRGAPENFFFSVFGFWTWDRWKRQKFKSISSGVHVYMCLPLNQNGLFLRWLKLTEDTFCLSRNLPTTLFITLLPSSSLPSYNSRDETLSVHSVIFYSLFLFLISVMFGTFFSLSWCRILQRLPSPNMEYQKRKFCPVTALKNSCQLKTLLISPHWQRNAKNTRWIFKENYTMGPQVLLNDILAEKQKIC